MPIDVTKTRQLTVKELAIPDVTMSTTSHGQLYTVGGTKCRFPSVAVDNQGICWVSWEREGDILLSSLNKSGEQESHVIESDSSDSFNPIIASTGKDVWVFYLNDIDNYYRLYGRYLNNGQLSAEIPMTEKAVNDIITPIAVSDRNGKLTVAWSEWKANNKYPGYRTISNRVLGDIKPIKHKQAASEPDYVCAWSPSLAVDNMGKVRGAWNQHYPATFAVYSGDLDNEPIEIGEGDIGGYPAVVFDKNNTFWVFWETFLWERAWSGKPQSIQGVYYDEKQNKFSVPVTISRDTQTVINQTPQVVVTPEGTMLVVWSGRIDEETPWGIYLSSYDGNNWSEPKMISPDGENSRAPSIAVSNDNSVWVAWHAGIGDNMQIKILKIE
jgi:hypothetical protein